MCDLLPFAVAHDLRLSAAERLHRRTARAAQARAARRVDVVPRAAELNGGQPLGEVEPVVVERRDDDPLRRAVAPASVFDEEFGRFGLPLRAAGFSRTASASSSASPKSRRVGAVSSCAMRY